MNIIDEASRFHVALVLKEGDVLGNLTANGHFEADLVSICKGTSCHSRGF